MTEGPAPEAGARLRPGILALFAAVVLAKSLVWTVALPPWYGPDEPQHFDYVQSLAVLGRPPAFAVTRPDGRDHPPEVACSQHAVGFRINGAYFAQAPWLSDPDPCPPPSGSASRVAAVDTDAAGGYSPLYYVLALPLWEAERTASVETRLQAVRLLSVALGVAGSLATVLAAWHALGRRQAPAFAAGSVFAFQPMATQQFAIFNNDALVVTLAAVFFWLAFRARAGGGFGWRAAALMGGVTGAAYVAKPQGAYLAVPFLLLALATLGVRRPAPLLRALAGFAVPLVALGGLARLLDLLLNGSLLSQAAVSGGHAPVAAYWGAYTADHLSLLQWLWLTGAWGHFAWLDAVLPRSAFIAIAAMCAAAGIGLAAGARRPALRGGLLAGLCFLSLVAMLQATELLYFRSHGTLILQGRSFLIALPAGAIALVAGLAALAPRRAGDLVARAVVGGMLALLVLSTGVVLEAFYG